MNAHVLALVASLLALPAQAEPAATSVPTPTAEDAPDVVLDGSLDACLDAARARSPWLEAARADSERDTHAVSRAARLPEPTASVGVYARSVETRVGPQLARLSVQQALPWPGRLLASRAQARSQARAGEHVVDAETLRVEARVRLAYWSLWEVRRVRRDHREHLLLLDQLAETQRARVETGSASLADLQQIDLTRARLADELASLDPRERAAEAALRAAIGLDHRGGSLPTTAERPTAELPAAPRETLRDLALAHPRTAAARQRAHAAEEGVRMARASRAPSLQAGVDWILTGPAASPDLDDSGKDAWIVGAGVQVPLWQGGYGQDIDAARADHRARTARVRATELDQLDALAASLEGVQDSARRHRVVRDTLLPQAEAAYASILGAYTVGEAGVSQLLLAQRDLLELRIAVDTTAAEHARQWASLEATCGQRLDRTPLTGALDGSP